MDLRIPNIVKPLPLSDYASQFGEAVIWIWVNPPRELRLELFQKIALGEASDEQIGALFSKLWSEGPEDTHMASEDVLKMANECMDKDPQLWWWLVNRTRELLLEHLGAKKKPSNSTPPS